MADGVEVFDRLLEITLLLQQDLTSSLGESGLTVARTHLLWVLHQTGPSTQQALANALDVSPRNVTGLVDALETSGHVERRPHPHDRRATLVTLTAHGAAVVAGMARDRQTAAAALVDGFDEQRRKRLGADLGALADRLRAMITTHQAGGRPS